MRRLAALLLLLAAGPAWAGRARPVNVSLEPWQPVNCEGDYVIYGSFSGIRSELARVPCVELPQCVEIATGWPLFLWEGEVRIPGAAEPLTFGFREEPVVEPEVQTRRQERVADLE